MGIVHWSRFGEYLSCLEGRFANQRSGQKQGHVNDVCLWDTSFFAEGESQRFGAMFLSFDNTEDEKSFNHRLPWLHLKLLKRVKTGCVYLYVLCASHHQAFFSIICFATIVCFRFLSRRVF